MTKFKKVKAKECPNEACKQIIPETWTAAYLDEWCPMCGHGATEDMAGMLSTAAKNYKGS